MVLDLRIHCYVKLLKQFKLRDTFYEQMFIFLLQPMFAFASNFDD